jgi:hypothetical protein
VSAFATKYIWQDLKSLKRRPNLSEFHSQFLDLAQLVEETVCTAMFGSRLYDLYAAMISDCESQILSAVIVTAHQTGWTIHLCDARNVVDESNLLCRGRGKILSSTGPGTTMTLAPGPKELDAISQTNACV